MSAEDKAEASSSASPPPSSYFIGKKDEIIEAGRVTKLVNNREVLVLHHDGVFHAMDMRCYLPFIHLKYLTRGRCHTFNAFLDSGGILFYGDIEEFNGRLCIVCPWHKYKITLAEGEGLYQSVDPKEKPPKPRWRSKGVKQRIHRAIEVDDDIFVEFNDTPGPIESDVYQTESFRARARAKLENPPVNTTKK